MKILRVELDITPTETNTLLKAERQLAVYEFEYPSGDPLVTDRPPIPEGTPIDETFNMLQHFKIAIELLAFHHHDAPEGAFIGIHHSKGFKALNPKAIVSWSVIYRD